MYYEFVNKNKKRYKTAEGRNLKFRLLIILNVQFSVAISHLIRDSEPKNEMPILGLNSSSSKINHTRGIKVSNLEASGHALSALKNKP